MRPERERFRNTLLELFGQYELDYYSSFSTQNKNRYVAYISNMRKYKIKNPNHTKKFQSPREWLESRGAEVMSFQDIADKLGVSEFYVRYTYANGMKKIKTYLSNHKDYDSFRDYLY